MSKLLTPIAEEIIPIVPMAIDHAKEKKPSEKKRSSTEKRLLTERLANRI